MTVQDGHARTHPRSEWNKQLHKARVEVLQSLFAREFLPNGFGGGNPFSATSQLSVLARELRGRIWEGITENRSEIDEIIQSLSHEWSLERMGKIDRNILRIGTYEIIREPEIPFRVSVDESLELAHQFSEPEAIPFINGILHQVGIRHNPEKVADGQGKNRSLEETQKGSR
ncbi:MAG: transcription antitermination factor NusB [Leptospirales bacterium]